MFAEDLSAFYSAAEFAESALHTRGGTTTSCLVIFDAPSLPALDGVMQLDGPAVRLQAGAVPGGVLRGDTLVVRGVTYTAREAGQVLGSGAEIVVPLTRA